MPDFVTKSLLKRRFPILKISTPAVFRWTWRHQYTSCCLATSTMKFAGSVKLSKTGFLPFVNWLDWIKQFNSHPSSSRDELMCCASLSRSPSAWVFLSRSLPAKSHLQFRNNISLQIPRRLTQLKSVLNWTPECLAHRPQSYNYLLQWHTLV